MLRQLGLKQQPQAGEMIEQSVVEFFERGWLVGDERLSVTDAGMEHLRRRMWETRGEVQYLSTGGGVHGRRPSNFAQGRRSAGVGAASWRGRRNDTGGTAA